MHPRLLVVGNWSFVVSGLLFLGSALTATLVTLFPNANPDLKLSSFDLHDEDIHLSCHEDFSKHNLNEETISLHIPAPDTKHLQHDSKRTPDSISKRNCDSRSRSNYDAGSCIDSRSNLDSVSNTDSRSIHSYSLSAVLPKHLHSISSLTGRHLAASHLSLARSLLKSNVSLSPSNFSHNSHRSHLSSKLSMNNSNLKIDNDEIKRLDVESQIMEK